MENTAICACCGKSCGAVGGKQYTTCEVCKAKNESLSSFGKHLQYLTESSGYSWDYMRAAVGAVRGVVSQNYNQAKKQLVIELLPGTSKQLVFNEIEDIIGATIQSGRSNTKMELPIGDVPDEDIITSELDSMNMVHAVLGSDMIDSVLVTWTDVSMDSDNTELITMDNANPLDNLTEI